MNWSALRAAILGERSESILPPNVKLPMLPQAVLDFSRRSADPDVSTAELGKIVEQDAGLTCELLRCANSSLFGLRTKASTAQQALSRLGIRTTKMILCSASVKQAVGARESRLINLPLFWATNLERAILARETAGLLRVDADLAFSAAMLQDFLLPVLTSELLDAYLGFTTRPESDATGLAAFEQARFGWDHALAAAQVLHAWQMPDDLVCCAALHHRGLEVLRDRELAGTAVAAVAVAALLPDPWRQVPEGLEGLHRLEQAWPRFRLAEVAGRVAAGMAEMSTSVVANHISFQRRCERFLAARTEPADREPQVAEAVA